jgi:hypothetical protein
MPCPYFPFGLTWVILKPRMIRQKEVGEVWTTLEVWYPMQGERWRS